MTLRFGAMAMTVCWMRDDALGGGLLPSPAAGDRVQQSKLSMRIEDWWTDRGPGVSRLGIGPASPAPIELRQDDNWVGTIGLMLALLHGRRNTNDAQDEPPVSP